MNQKKSLLAYFISCAVLLSLVISFPNWNNTGPNATLSWDVMGYYTYLPAGLIYKDLARLEFRDSIQQKYNPSGLDHAGFYHEPSGQQIMKYPMGMAVAYLPWFLMAHTTAIFSSYPADGFSLPYQFFIAFGCLFYAFVGLWYFRKILLHYFEDEIAGIVLLLIALGTNYLNYAAFDMAMPHNFVFTLYAILIWTTIHWYKKPSYLGSIVIGICIGWAALARPTEIVSAMIPVLWGLSNWESVKSRFEVWKKHFVKLLLAAVVVAAIGSLQLLYWKMISGKFLVYSYQDQGFSWWGVHLKDCFFSYRKGWLLYTPMMIFPIIGLFFYHPLRALGWRKKLETSPTPSYLTTFEEHFWAVLIFFLINTYIIFSWDVWWYGGGFGQRAMIPSYVLLGLPFAVLLNFIWKCKSNVIKYALGVPVALGILFSLWLNLHQTWQAHSPRGGFETENMTKAYYWKIFGTTNAQPEWKILLDTDEEFLGTPQKVRSIYSNDFSEETDSLNFNTRFTTSDSLALYLNNAIQFSPKFSAPLAADTEADWVRATANFYCTSKEWNYWSMSQFVISLEQDDKIVKEKMIRVQRLLGVNDWREIHIDLKIPEGQIFNNVKVKFWNAGGTKELWVDDLKIETFQISR